MKIFGLFSILILFFSSCAIVEKNQNTEPVYTVKTDIQSDSFTRSAYYEQMGLAYSADGQLEKAIEQFRLSLLHDPQRATAHMSLALEYDKAKMKHLALIELEKAYNINPDKIEIQKILAEFYLKNSFYSKALVIYKGLLANSPQNADEINWVTFQIYKAQNNFDLAMNVLSNIKQNESNSSRIYFEKALLYKANGDFRYYEENLNLALQKNPADRDIALEFAQYAIKRERFIEITKQLALFYKNNDFDLQISEKIAYAAARSNNYGLAINEYKKQLAYVKQKSEINLKLAHLFYLSGDYKSAQKKYFEVLDQTESGEAYFYISQIYLRQKKESEALKTLSLIPVESDFYGEAQVRLAMNEYQNSGKETAMRTMKRAFAERSDLLVIYRFYSDLLIQNKKLKEANEVLEKGTQIFSMDEDLRIKAAFVGYRLGNIEEFKKHIAAALQINPESADAYSLLTEIWYLKNKKPEEIVSFAQKAVDLKTKNKNVKPLLVWALLQQENVVSDVAVFEKFYEENPQEAFFARSLSIVYGRANITDKSQRLADVASSLEIGNKLKSGFIFKEIQGAEASGDLNLDPTRLPASIEH